MIEKQTMGIIVVLSMDAKSLNVERTVFFSIQNRILPSTNIIFFLTYTEYGYRVVLRVGVGSRRVCNHNGVYDVL